MAQASASAFLSSPLPGSETVPELEDGRITFRWHPVVGASSYRLHVSRDTPDFTAAHAIDFGDTVAYLSLNPDSPTWDWGHTYFWKVTANVSGADSVSEIFSFRIPRYDPRAPRFVRIGDSAKGLPTNTLLPLVPDLNGEPISDHYFEIAADSLFAEIIGTGHVPGSASGSASAHVLDLHLHPGGRYYFRVYANLARRAGSSADLRTGPSKTVILEATPVVGGNLGGGVT